ncbi:hypothetical protein D8B26_006513 [Coccidioides posadasii str. Silveira]|uniref:Predicted protein n=1 Tax=Coccidioides posadasii (strain RMSCC 757 / Silveira) TaxID=443226 RepID=E9CTH2_COCPS|nr:predicted protein [Coccidioides posadasii str. Silveira]QVM11870.1 hypothetical protein D8B26_006513 [Coccidioides posadasii str. Silveira]
MYSALYKHTFVCCVDEGDPIYSLVMNEQTQSLMIPSAEEYLKELLSISIPRCHHVYLKDASNSPERERCDVQIQLRGKSHPDLVLMVANRIKGGLPSTRAATIETGTVHP